ncbi:MAG: outer membrane beta-barrel protein [Aestuariivirgaceae bacterium]
MPAASAPADMPIAGLRPALIDPPVLASNFAGEQQSLESGATLRRRLERDLEAFPALGVRSGPILYRPSLVVEGVATDNLRGSRTDRIADIGLRLAPSLIIETDWVRHAFRFSGTAERIFYADQSEFDPTAADAGASLRLDLKGGSTVELAADYDLSEASAGADEVPQSAVGLRRDQAVGGSAAVIHDVGRIDLEARAGALAFVYSDVALADGGIESNRDRNYIEPQLSVKAGYGLKPGLKPYVRLEYAPRLHEQAVDRNGERRDSQGGAVSLGAVIDGEPVWSGDLALRYERRFYDDPGLDPAGIIGLAGNLIWRPSATTTFALTATSGLSETVNAGDSATPDQGVTLGLTQLFRDDVALTALGGVDWSGGEGGGDLTWTASLGITWALGRHAALLAGYDLTIFDSADATSSYVENRLSAGLQLRI